MEKSLDLQIQEFEDGLIEYINSSTVPLKAKAYVLGNVHQVVSQAASAMISKERARLQKEGVKNG